MKISNDDIKEFVTNQRVNIIVNVIFTSLIPSDLSKPQSYVALVSQAKLILGEGYNGLLLFQCTDHGLVVQESRHIVQMLGETGTMSPHLPQILYPNPAANSFFMLASQTDTRVYVSATDCMYRVSQKKKLSELLDLSCTDYGLPA